MKKLDKKSKVIFPITGFVLGLIVGWILNFSGGIAIIFALLAGGVLLWASRKIV